VRLFAHVPAGIALNEHIDAEGATVFRHVCEMGLGAPGREHAGGDGCTEHE
jgi:hypothetical protein